MKIETTVRTDGRVPVTVISLQGELDTLSYGELEKKGEEVYKTGARRIILDLQNVKHVSSAGLRAIHAIYNLLRQNYPAEDDQALAQKIANKGFKSRLLKLVKPNQGVLQVLRTSGYETFLEVHDDLDVAVRSF